MIFFCALTNLYRILTIIFCRFIYEVVQDTKEKPVKKIEVILTDTVEGKLLQLGFVRKSLFVCQIIHLCAKIDRISSNYSIVVPPMLRSHSCVAAR